MHGLYVHRSLQSTAGWFLPRQGYNCLKNIVPITRSLPSCINPLIAVFIECAAWNRRRVQLKDDCDGGAGPPPCLKKMQNGDCHSDQADKKELQSCSKQSQCLAHLFFDVILRDPQGLSDFSVRKAQMP